MHPLPRLIILLNELPIFVGSFSNITSTFIVSDQFEYGALASFTEFADKPETNETCKIQENILLFHIYLNKAIENDTTLKRVSCSQLLLPNHVICHNKSFCFIWIFIDPCLAALNVVGIYGHHSCNIDIKPFNAGWKCNGGDWQIQNLNFPWLLSKGYSSNC